MYHKHLIDQGLYQNLGESYCLKGVNILAIVLDLILCVILMIDIPNPQFVIIHGVAIFCSILYHLFPSLRTGVIFRFISHTISTLFFMLVILNTYGFLMAVDGLEKAIFLALLIFITGPCAIVSMTLILLLNYDTILVF